MSNNNDNSGSGAVGLVVGVIAMAGMVFAFLLVFLAFIFTILALMAWNKPLRLGKQIITPEEARSFVKRGIFFAWAVPMFCVFVEVLFQIPINWDYLVHMIVGGYALGSIGIEILFADEAAVQAPVEYIPPQQEISAPQRQSLPAPEPQPFRYASWNDEEQ